MSISVSVILTVDLDETSNRTVKNPKVLNDLIEGIFAVRRTALIAFASKRNCRGKPHLPAPPEVSGGA